MSSITIGGVPCPLAAAKEVPFFLDDLEFKRRNVGDLLVRAVTKRLFL